MLEQKYLIKVDRSAYTDADAVFDAIKQLYDGCDFFEKMFTPGFRHPVITHRQFRSVSFRFKMYNSVISKDALPIKAVINEEENGFFINIRVYYYPYLLLLLPLLMAVYTFISDGDYTSLVFVLAVYTTVMGCIMLYIGSQCQKTINYIADAFGTDALKL